MPRGGSLMQRFGNDAREVSTDVELSVDVPESLLAIPKDVDELGIELRSRSCHDLGGGVVPGSRGPAGEANVIPETRLDRLCKVHVSPRVGNPTKMQVSQSLSNSLMLVLLRVFSSTRLTMTAQ